MPRLRHPLHLDQRRPPPAVLLHPLPPALVGPHPLPAQAPPQRPPSGPRPSWPRPSWPRPTSPAGQRPAPPAGRRPARARRPRHRRSPRLPALPQARRHRRLARPARRGHRRRAAATRQRKHAANSNRPDTLRVNQVGNSAEHTWGSSASAITLACDPGAERDPRAFPWASHQPGRTRQRTSGRGQARALPGLRPWHQPASFDVLTHNVRPHIARSPGSDVPAPRQAAWRGLQMGSRLERGCELMSHAVLAIVVPGLDDLSGSDTEDHDFAHLHWPAGGRQGSARPRRAHRALIHHREEVRQPLPPTPTRGEQTARRRFAADQVPASDELRAATPGRNGASGSQSAICAERTALAPAR